MRIVALHAVRCREGLPVMRLDQGFVFSVMAVETQRRRCFRQMIIKLHLAALAYFVGDVASVAAHIKCSMATAACGHVQALGVTFETKVLALVARSRL